MEGSRVSGLECVAMDERCVEPTGRRIQVRARHYILAGGSINTPGLLLRSGAPDPYSRVGKRTFLHLTTFSWARFDEQINPFYGAPQSVYSDHFQWQDGATGAMGYKLEVPPMQPGFSATVLGGTGVAHPELMQELPNSNMMIALLRDGFHPDSAEGTVQLRGDDSPVLDYRMTDYTWDGVRRSYLSMAEIQFAAGARSVIPVHNDARPARSLAEAREMIDRLELRRFKTRLGSAHVMGGCAMGEDPHQAVTDSLGRQVDFRRVILIMTSNTGFNKGIRVGFQDSGGRQDLHAPLRTIFSPEFLDRLDEVIAFDAFDHSGIVSITVSMLEEIRMELATREIKVSFAPEVAPFLVDRLPQGDSARPLRGIMREYIEDPLSRELMDARSDEPIEVRVEGDHIVFTRLVPIL